MLIRDLFCFVADNMYRDKSSAPAWEQAPDNDTVVKNEKSDNDVKCLLADDGDSFPHSAEGHNVEFPAGGLVEPSSVGSCQNKDESQHPQCHTYKRRWYILFVFSFLSFLQSKIFFMS